MKKGGINLASHDEQCEFFLVLAEIFNFFPKVLSFKGVSPRNNGQNPKKKNLQF